MDRGARGFPAGDLRVSDADRDRALSELSEAFQAGRITADEFDERSSRVLEARTGRELAAVLADLPREGGPMPGASGADLSMRPPAGLPARRIGVGAIVLGVVAISAIVGAIARSGQHTMMFGHHSGLGAGGGGLIMVLVIVLIVLRVSRRHR
jgi:hypothetical protein